MQVHGRPSLFNDIIFFVSCSNFILYTIFNWFFSMISDIRETHNLDYVHFTLHWTLLSLHYGAALSSLEKNTMIWIRKITKKANSSTCQLAEIGCAWLHAESNQKGKWSIGLGWVKAKLDRGRGEAHLKPAGLVIMFVHGDISFIKNFRCRVSYVAPMDLETVTIVQNSRPVFWTNFMDSLYLG